MATIGLIIKEQGDSVANVQRRYGIVNGGGTQTGNFATLKSKVMERIGGLLGPARHGIMSLTVDGFAGGCVCSSGLYAAGLGTYYTIVGFEVPDGQSSLATQYRIPIGSSLTLPAAVWGSRYMQLISSLGVGRPSNIQIYETTTNTDIIRAQCGDAF